MLARTPSSIISGIEIASVSTGTKREPEVTKYELTLAGEPPEPRMSVNVWDSDLAVADTKEGQVHAFAAYRSVVGASAFSIASRRSQSRFFKPDGVAIDYTTVHFRRSCVWNVSHSR